VIPRTVPRLVRMDVDIWSDIACPWCYIGKRRFEQALERFEHRDDVRVTWRSFELDPEAPAERTGDLVSRLAAKYGMSVEQARAAQEQLVQTAAAEGLDFRFDIARSGLTFDGHRIIHLAAVHGLGDEMKERLLRAYFTEGELIADHDALQRMAAEVGISKLEARIVLGGDRYADAVRADEAIAQRLGIGAVPTFVVDRRLASSGANPPEQLLSLLRQGWEQRPQVTVPDEGAACGPDGC
jgi:predicted DsbA family dithiol-disulfide isomerase